MSLQRAYQRRDRELQAATLLQHGRGTRPPAEKRSAGGGLILRGDHSTGLLLPR